jgi:hypothetical protein
MNYLLASKGATSNAVSYINQKMSEVERYYDRHGGFSFMLPNGWTVMQTPGSQYASCYAPTTKGFRPSMGVSDTADFRLEAFEGSLQEYVAITRERLRKSEEGTPVEQIAYVTESGIEGVKLTYEMSHTAGRVRVWQFFFEGKDQQKVVVTCFALAENATDFEKVFDSMVRTFRC